MAAVQRRKQERQSIPRRLLLANSGLSLLSDNVNGLDLKAAYITLFCSFFCFHNASTFLHELHTPDSKKPSTHWIDGFFYGCGSRI